MKDLKIKYLDGNNLIISATMKGLQELEQQLLQLSSRFAEVNFQHADYLTPGIISDLRFSSRKNRIAISTKNGKGWDFEVDPGTWNKLKGKISFLQANQQRSIMLHDDKEAIPNFKMFLELEEEEGVLVEG